MSDLSDKVIFDIRPNGKGQFTVEICLFDFTDRIQLGEIFASFNEAIAFVMAIPGEVHTIGIMKTGPALPLPPLELIK